MNYLFNLKFNLRFALLALLILTQACSSKNKDEPKELIKKEYATIDASQEELLDSGKNFYSKKLYSISNESFQSLQNIYPIGPYREFAEIKVADARFYASEYALATPLYEAFVRDHPTSKDCAYAVLMAGRSYELSYGGLGRDTAPLDNALKLYKLLDKQYPTSPYAISAKKNQKRILEELLAKQEAIVAFYQKQELNDAADARLKEIRQELRPEIAQISSKDAHATLERRQQIAQQQRQATKIIQEQAPTQSVAKVVSKPSTLVAKATPPAPASKIQLMSCQRGMAIFNIKDPALLTKLSAIKMLTNSNGQAFLAVPNAQFTSQDQNIDCFNKNDLTITSSTIALRTNRRVAVILLERPARLLLLPE